MNAVFCAILVLSTATMLVIAPEKVLSSFIDGGGAGVQFAIKIFAVYAVWLSIMTIWRKIKFDSFLSKKMKPLISSIFPGENEDVYNDLAVNLSANLLGMGSAGTPAGISATEKFSSRKNRTMLLVINSTSIQIIPTTIIALRSTFGATSDIILPTLISTVVSTLTGALMVKFFCK